MILPWKAKEFTGEWPVYPECYIGDFFRRDRDDPWVSNGPGAVAVPKKYRPQDHPELPFEIAKLRHADGRLVSRFVRRWGLLGRREIEQAKRWGHVPEHYFAMPLDADSEYKVESVEWIRRQARRIHLLLSLFRALNPPDNVKVSEAILEFIDAEDKSAGGTSRLMWENVFRSQFFSGSDPAERDPITRALAENTVDVANRLIEWNVSSCLEGIRPYLSLDETPALRFEFNAMIEVAYLHVAQAVTDGASVTRCEECGAYFRKTDGRQRFCPPPLGAKDSPCGYKQRYRRYKTGGG